MDWKQKNDIEKILQHSTSKQQKIIAIEELSELIKEITKDLRGKESNILEEYCDCLIMLKQIELIYNLKYEDIINTINKKINRTFERLDIKN